MADFTIPTLKWFSHPIPGIVTQTITLTRTGRVQYQGSYWPARLCERSSFQSGITPSRNTIAAAGSTHNLPIDPKQLVMIVGREGITLLIESLG